MDKTVKIVVLDDGETWAVAGTVMQITESAYRALLNGTLTPPDFVQEDVVSETDV